MIGPKEQTISSHRNPALCLFSVFEYQFPALCCPLALGCPEQRQTRQQVNAECSCMLGANTILVYCFTFMSRSFWNSKVKTNPILYLDISPDTISSSTWYYNSISFSCFSLTLLSAKWEISLHVGYKVKMVAQIMGIFHLPVFFSETWLCNYCKLFESNWIHISTAAWSLSIMSHPQSLVDVPNAALLYMDAGEIADVVAIVLPAGDKASICNQGSSVSAAITVCKIICLYYIFSPRWQASSLLVFEWAVLIRTLEKYVT